MLCKVFLKSRLNFGEVQSGPRGDTILCSDAGMGVGSLDAVGLVWWNNVSWFLESWSAAVLVTPGICVAVKAVS